MNWQLIDRKELSRRYATLNIRIINTSHRGRAKKKFPELGGKPRR